MLRIWPGIREGGTRLAVLAFALLCLWPAAAAQAALSLHLDTAGLTAGQIAATRDVLDAALARLPPSMLAQDDRQIRVQWSESLPHPATGRARRHVLLLNRRLLTPLEAGYGRAAAGAGVHPEDSAVTGTPGDAPGEGGNAHAEVLATVLHELAHFHDRRAGLSTDPRLLDIAGWQVKVKRPQARAARNPFVDRTPDPYELTSPREFVAVNLEYFLLDPEYACRRPALHRYFKTHFAWAPPQPVCAEGFAYLASDPTVEPTGATASAQTMPALATLDPARVQAVEYLLAEGNSEPMSRWGHSMLRLVVCAPDRPVGPACRLDLQHHLVLSFRAFVDDVQLSSWRGLTGSYPSRLFVLPLEQVVDEYTRDQLRALQSIPLRLAPGDIATLLERAGQLHWSYDGRYYFVSNNCAVETFKLLHDGVPRLAGSRLGAITPTGLLRKLERQGIGDLSVLADADEARRLGYRFDSLRERYQAMYAIARSELALPQSDVEDWLQLPALQRRGSFEQAGLRATAALLVLEESARRHQVALARQELKRRYLATRDDGGSGRFDAAHATLQRLLADSGYLSRPAGLLSGQPGYGLPQAAEISVLQRSADARARRLADLGDSLTVQVQTLLDPAIRTELATVTANLEQLGTRMRRLNREAGGIELP